MAKYTADSKFIASIWPGELPIIRKYVGVHPNPRSGRCTPYQLKPVSRGGKPFCLEVSDAFENRPNPVKAAENNPGDRIGSSMAFDSVIVPCEEILANLLQEWTGGMIDMPIGGGMGIMAINGTVPTQAEHEQMMGELTIMFEHLFQEGERFHRQNEWKSITGFMRLSAEWLGHERIWSTPQRSVDTIACPNCRQNISSQAFLCQHCGLKLKALPPELAALNPEIIRPLAPPVKNPATA